MRRWALIAATPVLSLFLGATAIAIIAALTANACPTPTGGTADQPSAAAIGQIPAHLLAIYEQVGARYDLPWEILAAIATEECDQGRLPDPSCTLQPDATGPGTANPAGASGLMQIGIGGAAGDSLRPTPPIPPQPRPRPPRPHHRRPTRSARPHQRQTRPHRPTHQHLPPLRRRLQRHRPRRHRLRHPRHRRRQHLPRHQADDLRRTQLRRMLNPRLRHRLRQPVRPRPNHPIADRPRRRLQRHRPHRRARTRPRRPRQHHRQRLGQRGRLDLLPTNRWHIRRRLHLRRRRHHTNRKPRRSRLGWPTGRRVQRPIHRDRIRTRPRRPCPRAHRLPRRRRHRRRTLNERAAHFARCTNWASRLNSALLLLVIRRGALGAGSA